MGRARRARLAAADNEILAMAFGAVAHHDDQVGIESVKKVKHDEVIAAAGAARRSGVTWLMFDSERALQVLVDLDLAPDELPERSHGGPQAKAELREFLRANPHGVLIVATCAVDPTAVP